MHPERITENDKKLLILMINDFGYDGVGIPLREKFFYQD